MIGASTVLSHAVVALVEFASLSSARHQVDQLIERQHTFLSLALQQATKTPIFGWGHNERGRRPW